MTDSSVTFPSASLTLAGTMTTPDSDDGPFPAVLLIPGSGPVDRDSNHKRMRLDITGQLARALQAAGIASLRYDKRGVGASDGEWRSTGFWDNADDARAALDALRARPEVDPARVMVAGHSEGALLATIIAAENSDLPGVILLSASATPGEELLRWQASQIAPTLPGAVRVLLRLMRTDLEQKVARNRAALKATTADVVRMNGTKVNARWHREFMAFDPRGHLARITVPVLALTGGKDVQTKPTDVESIASLVAGPVEAAVIPDVSHILRRQHGPAGLRTYKADSRRPLDPRVTAHLTRWATARVSRRTVGDPDGPDHRQ